MWGKEVLCSLFRAYWPWLDMGNALSKGVSPLLDWEEWRGRGSCALVGDGGRLLLA